MATIICPTCGKTNPEELEICQFCGTILKTRGTEPLPPIRPGEAPVPKKTGELERTLPAWLRDIRKGGADQNAADAARTAQGGESGTGMPVQHINPPEPAQAQPSQKKAELPLDLLAGLSQSNEEEDVPDWLASLKTNLPGGPVPSPEPAAKPQPSVPPPAQQPEQPEDWLAGLQGEAQSGQPAAEWGAGEPLSFDNAAQGTEPISGETSDWMSSLRAEDLPGNVPTPAATPAPADEISSSDSLPDWLSSLTDDLPAPAPAAEPPAASSAAPAPALGDISSWLAGLDNDVSATAGPMASSAATELPATGDLPGWLSDSAAATAAAPSEPPAENSPAAAEASPVSDLPDWLAGLDDSGASATATAVPAEPPAANTPAAAEALPVSDLPDWLTGPGSGSTSATPAAAPAEPPVPNTPAAGEAFAGADMPDWLAGLDAGSASATPAAATPEKPPASETPAAANPATPAGEAGSASDLPDWLSTVISSKTPETPPAADQNQAKAFDTDVLKELGTLGGTAGLPDWMAGFGANSATPAPTTPEVPPAETVDQPASAAPESPASPDLTPAAAPAAENNQNLDSILSMDMPDWLSGFTPTETTQPAKAGEEAAPASAFGTDISPGNLPSWVQAMRPMESVISGAESGDEDQSVEKEGPLAGLRSVLPGQTGPLGTHKPSAFSIKLQVDPTQKAQAALLENLIASEAASQPVVTPKRVLAIRPLRWIIAAVLVLAVLIPAVLPNDIAANIFPAPLQQEALANPEINNFTKTIGALPASSVVLVVFDYQPGYAGEMEQAAGPVIQDLVNKNEQLAFVSGSPVGNLMSARLIAAHKTTAYLPGTNYVDLGYLPGGEAGIQVFASDPQATLGDANLWSNAVLGGLAHAAGKPVPLSSFAALIVLTDNPDSGRMWIEQTSQALGSTPLLMVISAQAEPMIRPYFDAGQVKGLVTGLAGGAAYQAATQLPPNISFWASYGGGMLAAELLILVGGVWALVEQLRARREGRQPPEEEDEA